MNKIPQALPKHATDITLANLLSQAGFSAYAAGFKRGYQAAVTGKQQPTNKELASMFQAEIKRNAQS